MVKRKLATEEPRIEKSPKLDLFGQFPPHIQLDILKKLEVKDFVKFKQCSEETLEIARNFRNKLPLKVDGMDFSKGNLKFYLEKNKEEHGFPELESVLQQTARIETGRFCAFLELPNKMLADLKRIRQRMTIHTKELMICFLSEDYEPSIMDDLIKLVNPKSLLLTSSSFKILFKQKELKTLKRVSFCNGEIEEADFIRLQLPRISILFCTLRTAAINEYLKQWMKEQRKIEHFSAMDPIPRNESEIFRGLESTVLWSPETHDSSPFAHLKEDLEKKNIRKIWSLMRNDGKKIFISSEKRSLRPILVVEEYDRIEEIEKWIQKIVEDYMYV